jgi:hypothetical protein
MKASLTEHVLANLGSMGSAARKGLPVLLLYGGIDPALAENSEVCEKYCVLPPAPDRSTAERARSILQIRGWTDFRVPERLERSSISLSPPNGSRSSVDRGVPNSGSDQGRRAATGNIPVGELATTCDQRNGSRSALSESILEHFDGFVDRIDGDTAYVTLKSREHGDVLYGQYPAALLSSKGVGDQERFICKTVGASETTRIEIAGVPAAVVTDEQLRAIDEEIERILPSDDSIDY